MGRYLTGSCQFFSCYEDFHGKDVDEIEIIETNEFDYIRHITNQNRCLFQLKRQKSAQDYINQAKLSKLGMIIGRFLTPGIAEEMGLAIEDLKQLEFLVNRLDNKHLYIKVIYDSYIKNNGFYLTEEQRLEAYSEYKKNRGEK